LEGREVITWIKGGEVIDPRKGEKKTLDIVIKKGKIERLLPPGDFRPQGDIDLKIIDASGMIVTPGLVDMHVHFREPGEEYKETIATGSQAAAAGGFTAVACMPNTSPVNDSRSVTEFILERARKANLIRVYPVAAISRGSRSESLTEFGDLKQAGAVAVSDDGRPVTSSELMRRAITEGSVKFIKQAKEEGISVTAETAPHYFSLDHTAVVGFDTNAKMYPPLREPKDVEAIKIGLSQGVIDAIATDHAPHSLIEKDVEFDKAAFGIIGLETALPLTLALVREGVMGLPEAIAKLSYNPASILSIKGGVIEEGKEADLTIIDLNNEYVVKKDRFKSKSHNSPFIGWQMKGKAILTMVGGKIVWESDELNTNS
jgi:dihydroorotase